MQHTVILTFKFVYEILKCDDSIKSYWLFEQYFPTVLFIMLYKVVLIFEAVDETYNDHSNVTF